MRTVDRLRMRATVARVFAAAADVERWPDLLPHYRRVRMLERRGDGGLVEMAAWRPFGVVNYPTWWVSEMRIEPRGEETEVTIVHEWAGPRWPLVGGVAADWVIGPVFIHGIASRTLAGIGRHVEAARQRGSGAAGGTI